MADPTNPPDVAAWLMRYAAHPTWWLRLPARVGLGLLVIGFFLWILTVIDQNWEGPGRVAQRLLQLTLPELPGLAVWLSAALITLVPTIALYLVLLSAWRVVEQRGWLVQRMTGDVTVALTGVEAKTAVGSVTASVSVEGKGTVSLPPPIRVVTAPRIPEQLLRSAANAIYKPVIVVPLAGRLTLTGQLSTVKISKQPPAPKDEGKG